MILVIHEHIHMFLPGQVNYTIQHKLSRLNLTVLIKRMHFNRKEKKEEEVNPSKIYSLRAEFASLYKAHEKSSSNELLFYIIICSILHKSNNEIRNNYVL